MYCLIYKAACHAFMEIVTKNVGTYGQKVIEKIWQPLSQNS